MDFIPSIMKLDPDINRVSTLHMRVKYSLHSLDDNTSLLICGGLVSNRGGNSVFSGPSLIEADGGTSADRRNLVEGAFGGSLLIRLLLCLLLLMLMSH